MYRQFAVAEADFSHALQTVGTELAVVEVPLEANNVMVKFHVLDCGGHPTQIQLVKDILGTANRLCCLVYSVTDASSFQAVKQWHDLLSAAAHEGCHHATLSGVLVATKTDLPPSRHQVSIHSQYVVLLGFMDAAHSPQSAACCPRSIILSCDLVFAQLPDAAVSGVL